MQHYLSGGRRVLAALCTAVLSSAGILAAAAASAPAAEASVTVTSHFVWTPTSLSISGDTTFLANGATNDRPGDLLFITANLTPHGISPCPCLVESQPPVGVWYRVDIRQWGVFNEDSAAMGYQFSYNVLVVPKASKAVFVHKASAASIHGDYTLLNSSLTNRKPKALIMITQNYDPDGSGGTYNPHNVGVRYLTSKKKWAIFNEDGAPMESGAAFNVLVGGQHATNGGAISLLKTSSKNRHIEATLISNRQTTGNPNNVTFTTPDFNWDGKGGTADSAFLYVGYSGTKEGVVNWTGPIPHYGSEYNILIYSS